MDYDNTDRGALFKNKKKQHENQPDYTGSIDVGGEDHYISAWLKTSKSGEKYMSLSVTLKDDAPADQPAATPPATRPQNAAPKQALRDMDDDIPF